MMPKVVDSDACPRPTADPEGAEGRTEVGVHPEGVGAGHLHEEGDADVEADVLDAALEADLVVRERRRTLDGA
jgi:hypothetical protein